VDQRFLQYFRDEISLVSMVERSNIELELIGDLDERVSTLAVAITESPTYANEVVEID
jgi:hypothetical protein